MVRRSYRQLVAPVLSGLAASLAVAAGWTTDASVAVKTVLAVGVGLVTYIGQAVLIARVTKARQRADANRTSFSGLPRPLAEFHGRADDIRELLKWHRDQVEERYSSGRSGRQSKPRDDQRHLGPTMILIHGKPGVGKSALARELASRLAAQYPDGQLYANLGSGGVARRPSEILIDFLASLGRSPESQAKADRLVKNFRSVTANRRVLVVLDAARSSEQVQRILPNSPSCTVIVTSRRSLAPGLGGRSYHLEVPGTDDAIKILAAFAATDVSQDPEHAVEILELCGRLPSALRSVGEQCVAGEHDLQHMANNLRPPATRLSRLAQSGRDIAERIGSEYERLTDRERRAFRLLTLVEASTFVPWVLVPLLEVEAGEAENIMAQLERSQLIETAGPDADFRSDMSFGLPRYRFHALFRLYAVKCLEADEQASEIAEARSRLDDAILEVCTKVLGRLEPYSNKHVKSDDGIRRNYLPVNSSWPSQIARSSSQWIGAEYRNLVRGVVVAYRRENWQLCWQIAAQLGECVPDEVDVPDLSKIFSYAMEAAEYSGPDPLGKIRVLLAYGSFLVAVERYGEAFGALDQAARECDGLKSSRDGDAACRLWTAVLRHKAEAWLQIGAYRQASQAAERAFASASGNDDRELKLLRILESELHGIMRPWSTTDETMPARPGDGWDSATWYHDRLRESESARRRREWREAEQDLREALRLNYGDARRGASVRYRLSRLFLEQWECAPHGKYRDDLPGKAIAYAAAAVCCFRAMQDMLGVVRARCLLARALIASGRIESAIREIDMAEDELRHVMGEPSEVMSAMHARLGYAHAELLLHQGRYTEARRRLAASMTYYVGEGDYWSELHMRLLLGSAERHDGEYLSSNATLWQAASAFGRCRDDIGLTMALEELAKTAEAMKLHATASELRVLSSGSGTAARRAQPGKANRERQ